MTEEVKDKISIWDVMELDQQEKQIKKILIIKTDECIHNGVQKTYVCDKDGIFDNLRSSLKDRMDETRFK